MQDNPFGLDGRPYSDKQIGDLDLKEVGTRGKNPTNVYVRQAGDFIPVLTGATWSTARDKTRDMIKRGIDWKDIWCDVTPFGVKAPPEGPGEEGAMWGQCLTHLMITGPETNILDAIYSLYAQDGDYDKARTEIANILDMPLTMWTSQALLEQIGSMLFGRNWQTELAASLGLRDARAVRYWMAGDRKIPHGVWLDLQALLRARNAAMSCLADNLDKEDL